MLYHQMVRCNVRMGCHVNSHSSLPVRGAVHLTASSSQVKVCPEIVI